MSAGGGASARSGLAARRLRKSYRRRPVIRDVSLELAPGEVVALLGPNGSGKTTCFYAIAGLVTPEGGQVLIDGQDVTGAAHVPPGAAWLGLPAAGDVDLSRPVGRGQHPRHPGAAEPDRPRGGPARGLLSEFGIGTCAAPPRWRSRAGSGGAWRSRVASPPAPPMCFWTSPSRAWTRSPGRDPVPGRELKGRGIGVLITDHNVRETLGTRGSGLHPALRPGPEVRHRCRGGPG